MTIATPSGVTRQAFTAAIGLLLSVGVVRLASAQEGGACGALRNHFGPYDYRTDRGSTLSIVEGAHFTPEVEALTRGITGTLGAELNYTLRAFPNHHRALLALIRYGKRTKSPQPQGLQFSVECFLDRAVRFRPDDTTVRMIYANFLFDSARPAEAEAQLQKVESLAGDNPFTYYNMGLIYMERKNFDKALVQARKAYALGFPRPDLRDQLKAAGKWKDADPSAPASPAASQAMSASGLASDAQK